MPAQSPLIEKMLRLCILAGLVAAAHTGASTPRRFLRGGWVVTAQAGSDVEVLILNTALGTAGGVPTVVVGTFAKDAFSQLYGPLAKSQAEGMEPIVTAFLEGTL